MNFRRYQNEIIVGAAFLMMFFAYLYKEIHVSQGGESGRSIQQKSDEINKVVALKKLWDDPGISARIDRLKSVVPGSKIQWNKKSKQLNVTYTDISAEELNGISKIVLNLGVQIKKFDLQRTGTSYKMELVCKW